MKTLRHTCIVLAALAVAPSAAAAHPSIYTDTAQYVINPNQVPNNQAGLGTETRYLVAHDGWTYELRESNGVTGGGVIDFKKLPLAYRMRPGYTNFTTLDEGDTGVQAHATCDVPALKAKATILEWQGDEPFFNYVPFQTSSAGIGDNPADWLPVIKAKTGLTLNAKLSLGAQCTSIGGMFHPADMIHTSNAALNAAALESATAPLLDAVDQLTANLAQLEAALGSAQTARSAAESRSEQLAATLAAGKPVPAAPSSMVSALDRAHAEIKRLQLEALPLRVKLVNTKRSKLEVTISGPPGRVVKLRATLSARQATLLHLTSRVLVSGTQTTRANGRTTRTFKVPHRTAARMKTGMRITLEARTRDRVAHTTGTFTR